jgi:hypothetical protein
MEVHRRGCFMREPLNILRERFGERFGGMRVTAAETIYWPVYRHVIRFSVTKSIPLNVVEEGLLRAVLAGVTSIEELSRFLGAGIEYLRLLALRMSTNVGQQGPALVCINDAKRVTAGPALEESLRQCVRVVQEEQEEVMLRDGLFGIWLNLGKVPFDQLLSPQPKGDRFRWLGTLKHSRIPQDPDMIHKAMAALSHRNEGTVDFSEIGALGWVEVTLGVYQADDDRRGHFLVFNAKNDLQPLDDLSTRLEELLGTGNQIPLHFNDRIGSGKAFWSALASGVKTSLAEEQLKQTLTELAQAERHYHEKRRHGQHQKRTRDELILAYNNGIMEALVWMAEGALFEVATAYRHAVDSLMELSKLCPPTPSVDTSEVPSSPESSSAATESVAAKLQVHEKDSRYFTNDFSGAQEQFGADLLELFKTSVNELRSLGWALAIPELPSSAEDNLFKQLRDAQRRIAHLQEKVESAPKVCFIETKDHPELLRRAFKEGMETIVVFSPWIKSRVINQLLPDIESALRRGCEIWIGYGMPPDKSHDDNSDAAALESLKSLYRFGKLFLVDFSLFHGTHAKELACDDKFYVATSFNWLSYSGKGGRRETGLLVTGRSFVRDRLDRSTACLSDLLNATEVRRKSQVGV